MSYMGKRAVKPLKEYNLEARAHKIISREKPKPAPRHPNTPTFSETVIGKKILLSIKILTFFKHEILLEYTLKIEFAVHP